MLDFYARIGIREGGKDEEKPVHGGSGCFCLAVSETPASKIIRKLGVAELPCLRRGEDESRSLNRFVGNLPPELCRPAFKGRYGLLIRIIALQKGAGLVLAARS